MYARHLLLALAASLTTSTSFAQAANHKPPTASAPGAQPAAVGASTAPPPPVATPGSAFSPDTCDAKSLEAVDAPVLAPSQEREVCSTKAPFLSKFVLACPNGVKEVNEALKKQCGVPPTPLDPKETKLIRSAYLVTRVLALPPPTETTVKTEGAVPTPASIFAQGVGDFLTTRAEQEVSAYATVELYSRACSSDDVQALLPKTCALLSQQDDGGDPVGLGTLTRVVQADLQSLPQNAIVMALPKATTEEATTAICVADVGFALVNAASKVPNLRAVVIPDFKLRRSYGAPEGKTKKCDEIWSAAKGVLQLVFTPPTTELDRSAGVNAAGTPDATDMAQAVLDLVDAIKTLQDEKNAETKKQDRVEVVKRAAILTKLLKDKLLRDNVIKATVSDELVDETGDIVAPLWNHDWVGAAAAVASAQHVGQLILCGGESNACDRERKARLVISVAADIAEAKSSSDVQGALNRLAEPIGSWRRKFEDTFTLSLNGYAGVSYGAEWVAGGTPVGSFFAPHLALGLDWSFFLGKNQRLSVFTQVVDVGNVASVHFAGKGESGLTKVETDSNATVKQLFAPGVYLMVAPAKTPFALGVGGDWVPDLRTTVDGNHHSAWQLGVTAAVDVPIMELAHE